MARNGRHTAKGKCKVTAELTDTANSITEDCRAKASTTTLTKEQGASSQGPADLHIMNLHVLVGNVLHRNFLCNLKKNT